MQDQVDIVNDVLALLSNKPKEKLVKSLQKNPDFYKLTTSKEIEFRCKMMYASLVSVDVERTFSVYKSFLRDNRTCFKEENIEMLMIIQCNKSL